MLRYKNPSDYIIVLGWIFNAQIFAALPWRPHIWITGERGSGKSAILNFIHDVIVNSIITQGSTAAGIRQRIQNNAFVIISDESEPNTEKERSKLAEVLELARQSSTRANYETLRGSAGGTAISYNTNTCFCMGSIQLSAMGGADTSRFFVIEMKNLKDQAPGEYVRIQNAMSEIKELSTSLLVYAVSMYDNHMKNIDLAKKVIIKEKIESRQADQLAPIIAGYWAYLHSSLMNEQFVIDTINELNFDESEYAQANKENDSERCLNYILDIKVPGIPLSVSQIIDKYKSANEYKKEEELDNYLGLIGLKYRCSTLDLAIHPNNSELSTILKNGGFTDVSKLLSRHPMIVRNSKHKSRTTIQVKINGVNKSCRVISLKEMFS